MKISFKEKSHMTLMSFLCNKGSLLNPFDFKVSTSSGNQGKPGKSLKNSMHGKVMEFKKPE